MCLNLMLCPVDTHQRAWLRGVSAGARCSVDVMPGIICLSMLMFGCARSCTTDRPHLSKRTYARPWTISTGKEVVKQECIDTSVIALCFRSECHNEYVLHANGRAGLQGGSGGQVR